MEIECGVNGKILFVCVLMHNLKRVFELCYKSSNTFNYYFVLEGATKDDLNYSEESHGFTCVSLGSYKSTVQMAVYDKVYIEKDNINDIKYYLYYHEELKFMRIDARVKLSGNHNQAIRFNYRR